MLQSESTTGGRSKGETYPGGDEVAESKGQDDGRGGCVCHGHDVDQHDDADLTAVADAHSGVQAGHAIPLIARPWMYKLISNGIYL